MTFRFLLAAAALCVSGASASAQDLPEHLRDGNGHFCLNAFSTPSRAACDKLIEEAALARGCESGSATCLMLMVGIRPGTSFSNKELAGEVIEYRESAREQARRAQAAEGEGAPIPTKAFILGEQIVSLPVPQRIVDRGNLGSSYMTIWTNLDPRQPCPGQAYVFIEFFGVNQSPAFESWHTENTMNAIRLQVRRALETSSSWRDAACVGEKDYEVVYNLFDERAFFATIVVPPRETGASGDGLDYMMTNLGPTLARYGEERSRYYR